MGGLLCARLQEVCERLRSTAADADAKQQRVASLEAQLMEALNSQSSPSDAPDEVCRFCHTVA